MWKSYFYFDLWPVSRYFFIWSLNLKYLSEIKWEENFCLGFCFQSFLFCLCEVEPKHIIILHIFIMKEARILLLVSYFAVSGSHTLTCLMPWRQFAFSFLGYCYYSISVFDRKIKLVLFCLLTCGNVLFAPILLFSAS